MQANQLPSSRGWTWLRDGLQLWRKNPPLITFAAFGYLLVLVVVSIFPIIGQLVASLIMPALSVGVLNACRAVDAGRKVGPDVLLSGFRTNLPALIAIGGIYLIGTLIVLLLVSLVDDGTLMEAMRAGQIDEAAAADSSLGFALLVALSLSTPLMMAYWFAPMLAAWWKMPAPKAMFFSFYACLRNWRPFLAYAIGLLLFGAFLPGILIGVLGMVSPTLATLASVPVPLILVPVLFASFYANACDVFGLPEDGATRALPPARSPGNDD
ncbi:MAG TPA: BPSS1780 family membrane protein [Thauera sp.]|nr:BPSS1780 family membrane protein [Thauera sp.]HRA80487.1 BPSS1780 family membrane protein [Thauera sp.]